MNLHRGSSALNLLTSMFISLEKRNNKKTWSAVQAESLYTCLPEAGMPTRHSHSYPYHRFASISTPTCPTHYVCYVAHPLHLTATTATFPTKTANVRVHRSPAGTPPWRLRSRMPRETMPFAEKRYGLSSLLRRRSCYAQQHLHTAAAAIRPCATPPQPP